MSARTLAAIAFTAVQARPSGATMARDAADDDIDDLVTPSVRAILKSFEANGQAADGQLLLAIMEAKRAEDYVRLPSPPPSIPLLARLC